MFRLITPTIFILAAIGIFFIFTRPVYDEVKDLRATQSSYNKALSNSRQLKEVRDQLLVRYNGFSTTDLARLERMLPDHVDNIRLVIEIEKIAAGHNMAIRNVEFEPWKVVSSNEEDILSGIEGDGLTETQLVTESLENLELGNKPYGVFDLEFTTQGSYSNFIAFLKDLERNLRIVDVDSIKLSVSSGTTSSSSVYEYELKIKTYWLKQ